MVKLLLKPYMCKGNYKSLSNTDVLKSNLITEHKLEQASSPKKCKKYWSSTRL